MTDSLTHIRNLAKNKEQFAAVKDFLLAPLEPQNWLPKLDSSQSDEWYGQQVKMRVEARNMLLEGFEDMERLIEEKESKPSINQLR